MTAVHQAARVQLKKETVSLNLCATPWLNANISINSTDTKVGQYIKDKFNIEFQFEKYTEIHKNRQVCGWRLGITLKSSN